MWHVREASLHSAKIVTASLAESLSQQIETTLKTADTVVASLVQRVESDGMTPENLQRLYGLMTSLAAALPAIHEMGVTDKDGNAIVKSLVPHPVGMNYRERDYFRFLSSHDTRDVFIGQPVKSKVDGSINITVSRRINAPTRIWPKPYDHGRSHGCALPSTRFTSSSEKNRHVMSSPICSRTSRIQTDVWYAYGHIGSK